MEDVVVLDREDAKRIIGMLYTLGEYLYHDLRWAEENNAFEYMVAVQNRIDALVETKNKLESEV